MTDESRSEDLERQLAGWCHAAAPHPASDLADRCLGRTAAVAQRRGWGGLSFAPVLAAVAAVLIAAVIGLQLGNILPRGGNVGTGPSVASVDPAPSHPATPDPSAAPTIAPTPSGEVFPDGKECTNEEIGFTVGYPADWWANEAVVPDDPALDPIPGCTYFAEEPVELQPNAGLPQAVAISFGLAEEPLGDASQPYEVVASREVRVDSREATVEEIEWTEDTGFQRAGDRSYAYRISLPDGRTLAVGTSSQATLGEYADHKEILDRMMETLELTGS